ncbi:serine/threonine protein kinase [Asanoa ferruginea]|uniref:non-specific serine/threonine protein kinase n=2 Tax=Asanoa ferruginea TaxID=53367 RepID=A0A3D9ZKB6_9ACTN|nr:serine/threonine-protein kinase [Asanoa ferruginea]REF97004.1 serine/threonine protein kinase [Asanoa ferruginea]GIF50194.1 serine/threonine protein kinase [Asanoa ferruginea]
MPTDSPGIGGNRASRAAPGATIGGRYSLRAAVGHGGMGTVWRASDVLLRRDVAVKEVVLPPGLAPSDRDSMYERTMREARAAAALQHPSVVQVYDVVQENGRPWIVMELLDARSLADMVIEDGPVAARAVAKIGIALLGALEIAHANGVLHRDVKPANVLICADGRCVLTDFGVARMPTDVQLTTPGMVLGSPHFISPERAMGQDFGPPSDLFSLGVTLYTAVEGRPPFDKGDPIETMHAVVEDPPAPTSRAGVLNDVLMGLLEKDPARRYDVATARSMLRELLAGPLASKAPAHMMTDPYAVVPAQRSPWQPVAPPPERPTGQIGGRAMLAPGESLTERLSNGQPVPAAPGLQTPTGQMPTQTWGQQPPAPPSGGGAVAGLKRRGGDLVDTVRGWPRKLQLGVAGGLAVVLIVIGFVAFSGGDDQPTQPVAQSGGPSSAPSAADFPTQVHALRGVSVNVPKGWKRAGGGKSVYYDYIDPDDSGRKVRILVEDASSKATPSGFLAAAERGLKSNSKSCPKPYKRVDLREGQIDGRVSGELEYTCGEERHGVWGAVINGGHAYSFFLTSTEDRFAASKPIFDEMVRSFQLVAN